MSTDKGAGAARPAGLALIGGNTGIIIVPIGGRACSARGDEVNVAARLEQLNKRYGTRIMLSEQTARAARQAWPFERLGEVTVRGRTAPTVVYSLGA